MKVTSLILILFLSLNVGAAEFKFRPGQCIYDGIGISKVLGYSGETYILKNEVKTPFDHCWMEPQTQAQEYTEIPEVSSVVCPKIKECPF